MRRVARSEAAFWVGYAAAELKPLYLRLRELILASGKIAVDETVAPVLDPGRGRTKKDGPSPVTTGRGAGRTAISWSRRGPRPQAAPALSRHRDGYAAYKSIADTAWRTITLAFCCAHLRRRFFDIAKDGSAPIASEALERIAALYAIENTIRGHIACERRAVRQEQSKPLVLELKRWFEHQLARVSGKSLIAEARRWPEPVNTLSRRIGSGLIFEVRTSHSVLSRELVV